MYMGCEEDCAGFFGSVGSNGVEVRLGGRALQRAAWFWGVQTVLARAVCVAVWDGRLLLDDCIVRGNGIVHSEGCSCGRRGDLGGLCFLRCRLLELCCRGCAVMSVLVGFSRHFCRFGCYIKSSKYLSTGLSLWWTLS